MRRKREKRDTSLSIYVIETVTSIYTNIGAKLYIVCVCVCVNLPRKVAIGNPEFTSSRSAYFHEIKSQIAKDCG